MPHGFHPGPPRSFPFEGPALPVGLDQGTGCTPLPCRRVQPLRIRCASITVCLEMREAQRLPLFPLWPSPDLTVTEECLRLPFRCPLLRLSFLLGASRCPLWAPTQAFLYLELVTRLAGPPSSPACRLLFRLQAEVWSQG